MASADCPACRGRFSGVASFDAHQDRDYTRQPPVICRSPADCGLVRNDRGRWGFPLDEAGRAYFASRAAERAEVT